MKTLEKPVVAPKVEIDAQLLTETVEDSQVIVHCTYKGSRSYAVRIWPSTILVDLGSPHVSKLVHTENLLPFPEWTPVARQETRHFILVFTGLPKNCKAFDFIERIPEPDGFAVLNIPRNSTDVYHIDF